jgi:hypothetical protein
MGQTEPRTPSRLERAIGLAASVATLVMAALALLGPIDWVLPLSITASISMSSAAGIEIYRINHCGLASRAGVVGRRIRLGFARLCLLAGGCQLIVTAASEPLVGALVGTFASATLLLLAVRRSTVSGKGKRRPLARARASLVLATVLALALFTYVGIATAVLLEGVDESEKPEAINPGRKKKGDSALPDQPPSLPVVPAAPQVVGESEVPINTEPCHPPSSLGHGFDRLFERTHVREPGCGQPAVHLENTGAWVSLGLCEGSLRSVAATGPNGSVLLTGDAAKFAWEQTQDETLIGAEAATAGSGEVDLVATLAGTYGFARADQLIDDDGVSPHSCGEAERQEKPFIRLPPPFVLLWSKLLEHEATWSWPVSNSDPDEDRIVFVSYPYEALVATGGCITDRECTLSVEDEVWPGEGSGFVSMAELRPYMPPPAG